MVDAGLINSDELYLVEGEEGITYTFADGTAGNFTVTPSNGEAQTVSVGKPATAGAADTAVKFATSQSITLTGDTTGSASSQAGWSIATTTSSLSGDKTAADAISKHPGDGKLTYYYHVDKGTAGLFSSTNNANAIFSFNKHEGNYDSQLGFNGSDGRVYYRNFNGSALNTTTEWKSIAFVSDITKTAVGLSNVTNHQQVHEVAWDKTNKKITRSKNGAAGDVVQFVQGDNITLTAADGKLTIASSFTNSRDPGYGKIKPGAASTAVTGITANTTSAEASTYNETLTINPGNKWIQLAGSNSSTAGSDTLTIGHALSGVTAGTTSPNTAQTPGFNSTFNIPTVTFDAAGHITSTGTTTVKIPAETTLSGGSAAANDATVAGGVTVSGHAVTVAKKTLTAGGGIKITGATDKVTIAHSNASITAKTAAAQSAKTLTWGGTFTIYEEKYDAYGHITGVASYNMTMPANPNTDEKVKQNLTSENASYKLLTTTTASPTSGTAYEANYSANLAYNPSENKLSTGNLDLTGELDVVGNANLHNQTTIDSATVGSLLVNGSANFNQIPTAPTAAAGTSNTQLATTEFVTNATSGLSSAMHFIGKATVAITDGSTTNPSISGYDFTSDRKPGDVIIDKDNAYEYVWTIAGAWERLGPDGSYKVLQPPVTDPTANGSATAFISSIAQDANGNITVAKKDLDTSGTWSGNAATATSASKLQNTSKIGDTNKPVYFTANGVPTAISYTIDKSVPSNAVFTDRYVNSAAFADDTTNTAASPVKMTLTRAGSDSATVTANIPKVSSSSAGVAPKGAAVSSQSQSTKFLREDGTWAAPSYTINTNTDTLVKQTAKSDNVNYKILMTTSASPTSGNAAEAAYDADITINPSTNTITATNFAGTATKATQDGSGNNIAETYVKKSGDTMTGNLILERTNLRVLSPGTAGIEYSFIGSDISNTLGIAYHTEAYSGSQRTTQDIQSAGWSIFRVPMTKNGTLKSGCFIWGQQSLNSSTGKGTGYYEYYKLPETDHDLTATVNYDILTTKTPLYWANTEVAQEVAYDKEPEIKSVIIGNGSGTTAATKKVQLIYDSSLEVLNFVFT